jgi:hypothetical protein
LPKGVPLKREEKYETKGEEDSKNGVKINQYQKSSFDSKNGVGDK